MPDIITGDDYGAIRELLGVDAVELTDVVIEMKPYLPSAELAVKRSIGDWAERLDDAGDAALLQAAVLYGTALRLISRQANRQRGGERSGNWSAGQIDWKHLAAELQVGYAAAIGALLEDADDGTLPSGLFTVDGISRRAALRDGCVP